MGNIEKAYAAAGKASHQNASVLFVGAGKEEGLQRLQDVAGAELIDDSANYSEADLSEHAAYYRKQLADKADQKQREAEKIVRKRQANLHVYAASC